MIKRIKFFKICMILFLMEIPLFLNSESVAYFSPEDNISSKLIDLISKAKDKIHAAVFVITDKNIAQALIDAKNRGVDVQVVTDRYCLENESGKVDFLKDSGIDIFVFKDKSHKGNNNRSNSKFRSDALMHDKFALIDKKLWTGSFNWTVSADKKNKENVIFTDDLNIYKKYEKEFDNLKHICTRSYACYDKNKKEKKYKELEKSYYQNLKETVFQTLKTIRDSICN